MLDSICVNKIISIETGNYLKKHSLYIKIDEGENNNFCICTFLGLAQDIYPLKFKDGQEVYICSYLWIYFVCCVVRMLKKVRIVIFANIGWEIVI